MIICTIAKHLDQPEGRMDSLKILTSSRYDNKFCHCPQFSDDLNICSSHPKIRAKKCFHTCTLMFEKDAGRIANNDNPDQTAPLGSV